MNKYLMLSAAALLGTAFPLAAANDFTWHTIHFYSQSGYPYCDGMSFHRSGRHLAVGLHLNEDCGGKNGEVAGTVDRKQSTLFESFSGNETLQYDIYKPIRNGGQWDLWACFSNTSCSEISAGTYKLGFPAEHRGQISTAAKVGEMIAARKAARAGK
jgi:hypothetical protein